MTEWQTVLAKIDEQIDRLKSTRQTLLDVAGSDEPSPKPKAKAASKPKLQRKPRASGESWPDAIGRVLESGDSLTPAEIVERLRAEGREFPGDRTDVVGQTLRRCAEARGWVYDGGRWSSRRANP